uniref:Putative secreted protein n=1 Tax=Anopheles triannulatus TaxID=58253 RepID=A0A2M4B802_9DIPT
MLTHGHPWFPLASFLGMLGAFRSLAGNALGSPSLWEAVAPGVLAGLYVTMRPCMAVGHGKIARPGIGMSV